MNQSAWLNAAILRTPAEWKRQDVKKKSADGTITKLEKEADGMTGKGGGIHCEWMGL